MANKKSSCTRRGSSICNSVSIIDTNKIALGFINTSSTQTDIRITTLSSPQEQGKCAFCFSQYQLIATSPTSQHILDITPVLQLDEFRDLLFRQPLKILDTLRIPSQIGLACHNTTLHEKGLLAQRLFPDFFVGLGLSVVVDVVADGVVTDHPGVHIDTSGLCKGTFSGLSHHN